jgi:hypothetical protein
MMGCKRWIITVRWSNCFFANTTHILVSYIFIFTIAISQASFLIYLLTLFLPGNVFVLSLAGLLASAGATVAVGLG